MSNENDWNPCNSMGILSDCDVVLTNGDLQCIGIKYDKNYYDNPYLAYKEQPGINTYQRKVIETMGIPCVENKALVHSLFDDAAEGQPIPRVYWKAVAAIYSNLPYIEKENEKSLFERELREDIQKEIYKHEKDTYTKVIRNFNKLKPVENSFVENVARYFEEEIRNLTADYEMNTRSYHNSVLMTDEFYLETCYEKYDIQFRLMIFVAAREQQIYIGARNIFVSFNFAQAQSALNLVQLLVKTCNEKLMYNVQIYCEEFDINPRLFEIAKNSIETIVEMNYKLTGLEYGLFYDKTRVSVFIKKKETKNTKSKPRMFQITITYREYSKTPEAFKEIIKNPTPRKQWNFWCCELKYDPKCFNEKFQTIES